MQRVNNPFSFCWILPYILIQKVWNCWFCILTLKAPITTAADNNFFLTSFLVFDKNKMIFHENHLPADDSHEISCIICYFWKAGKFWKCCLLQIIGGALWVNRLPVKISIKWCVPVLKNVFILANTWNSAGADEMQSYVAFHLGLHCLTKYLFTGIQYEKDWAWMHLFFNHNVVPDQLACFQFILWIHVILFGKNSYLVFIKILGLCGVLIH